MTQSAGTREATRTSEAPAWHTLSAEAAVQQLDADIQGGLSAQEAEVRRARYGLNELAESAGRRPLQILWEQLSSAMILLLAIAAVVSILLGEMIDAAAIVAIIALNSALGFVQDYRAERALAALKRMAVPSVKVRRDGQLQEVPAQQLVPGDVVTLEVGNLMPADCRLLESVNLKVEEASLTGESEPVTKQIDSLPSPDVPLGDRTNMVFMGTLATYGHAVGVVVETGMRTELGRIASSLQSVQQEPTPLQRRLAQLGRTLAIVSLGIVAVVFGLGVLAGEPARLMVMTALSLAVAIVPEGLPAVATVALAIGARRMMRRQALIRKLPAVETLGSVTVICSDKTGTLTENRMTVTVLDVAGRCVELTQSATKLSEGSDEKPAAYFSRDDAVEDSSLTLLLAGAALCNDAELANGDPQHPSRQALGEPTEAALAVAAAQLAFNPMELSELFPRVDEAPFDSQRKRMTTVHEVRPDSSIAANQAAAEALRKLLPAKHVLFMKGAVDAVLDACTHAWHDHQGEPLSDPLRERIEQANDRLASQGIRVLGIAFRSTDDYAPENIESDLVFVGLLGLIDPPRVEAQQAVSRCRAAGIRPVMITGDHPLTAQHIAQQLGIADTDGVLVGDQLARMSAQDLEPVAQEVPVYARVAPSDKLHIVQALQNQGEVVAMTGDGVNDAPALKQAHIGVAMGKIGTDVCKESADMVLLDDNFATIVNAVEEGRIVYDNIRKFVKYTMTSNAGEVWVMVLAPLLGMPLPLLPLQILWVNLVTDGLPGLALAVEHAERNAMKRPPYPPGEHIMGRGMWRDIAWVGLLMGFVSLALGYWTWDAGSQDDAHWRTIVFTVLTLSQMGNALAIRSQHDSLFQIGLFSNKAMLGSVLLTFLLQLAVVYWPPLQSVFKTTALTWGELGSCLLLSTTIFWTIEIQKLLQRRSRKARMQDRASGLDA